ncbi:hypothetical protein MTO96_003841 [Rhipicephalus appendiculatus]
MSRDVLGHHNVVVDSCWTLLPLSALSAMLAAMVNKNSALFYVAFMDEYGVSHQAASWPITAHAVMAHLTGLGYGMIVLSLSIYAMVYFDKYRGTASGFKYTGMALAPLAFPLALSALIRVYNLSALALAVIPQVNSFPLVVVMSFIMGCSSGCVVVLKPVLLSDHLGVDMLPFCWGLAGVAMIPFSVGGSLLIGLFRDAMGSYDNLYRTLSAFCCFFAIMLFTLAFFQRRAEKRLDHAKKSNEHRNGKK